MPPIEFGRLSGVSQGYGNRRVIDSMDLTVTDGVTGLLGPNGAGKTTLLQTLSTISPPRRGKIYLFGEEIRSERDARRARRKIGYLPQDFGYYPNFSIIDFVQYCAWLREVPGKKASKATRDAIADVGLTDHGDQKMKSLSGGMLRRAGIAAAIVGDPSLIILDEPTVGLDPAQRLDFRNLIRSVAKRGAAVLLSTHLVEDVGVACDTVIVLQAGKITYSGTPMNLAASASRTVPGDSPLERGYMTVLSDSAPSRETS